jgi:hypothetical protein
MPSEVCSFIHLISVFKSYRLNKHQIVKVTCVFFLNIPVSVLPSRASDFSCSRCETSLSIHFF